MERSSVCFHGLIGVADVLQLLVEKVFDKFRFSFGSFGEEKSIPLH